MGGGGARSPSIVSNTSDKSVPGADYVCHACGQAGGPGGHFISRCPQVLKKQAEQKPLKFRKCQWGLECKGWKAVDSCPYWHPGEPDEPPGQCNLTDFGDDAVIDIVVNSNNRFTFF